MKIAVATTNNWLNVSGHAGQARTWLLYDCAGATTAPKPRQIVLTEDEVPHNFKGARPHPLDGVSVVATASAGQGFVRHMAKRGSKVVLTQETDPGVAVHKILSGTLPYKPWLALTGFFCMLRNFFKRP